MSRDKSSSVLPVLTGVWEILMGVGLLLSEAVFISYYIKSVQNSRKMIIVTLLISLAPSFLSIFMGVCTFRRRSWIRPWGFSLGIWGLIFSSFTFLTLFLLVASVWETLTGSVAPGILYGMLGFFAAGILLYFVTHIITYGGDGGRVRFSTPEHSPLLLKIPDSFYILIVLTIFTLFSRIASLAQPSRVMVFGVFPPLALFIPFHIMMAGISLLSLYFLIKANVRGLIIQGGILLVGGLNHILNYRTPDSMLNMYLKNIPPGVNSNFFEVLIQALRLPLIILSVSFAAGGIIFLFLVYRKGLAARG